MSGKSETEIHIVFQVLNFVYGTEVHLFNILDIDKHILILLAKHAGPKGIYPSTKTLSKELKKTPTYIKRRINFLDEKKLIQVIRKTGVSHRYAFTFLNNLSTPVDRLVLQLADQLEVHDPSTPVDQSTPVDRSTAVSPTGQLQVHDRSTTVDPIRTYNQILISKQRGGLKRPSALPDNFQPNAECKDLANDHNLSTLVFDKFKAHHKAHGTKCMDWNAKFMSWLVDEIKNRELRNVSN